MKFLDKASGAIYEPSDRVAAMMRGNPNLEPIDEKPEQVETPKKTTRKRTTKAKE